MTIKGSCEHRQERLLTPDMFCYSFQKETDRVQKYRQNFGGVGYWLLLCFSYGGDLYKTSGNIVLSYYFESFKRSTISGSIYKSGKDISSFTRFFDDM